MSNTQELQITKEEIEAFADRLLAWISNLPPKDQAMAAALLNAADLGVSEVEVEGFLLTAGGASLTGTGGSAAVASAIQAALNARPPALSPPSPPAGPTPIPYPNIP